MTGCIKNNYNYTKSIDITIDGKTYEMNLENNKTVIDFLNKLPQKYKMNELNDNEKYVYLDYKLPNNEYNPKSIKKGDVYLYGDNCLVIFYKDFNTSYKYTKIGHINNLDDLGDDFINVEFSK